MSPRCYRTQRYTIKKNNIKRTLYFFVFWSIFAPMKILYTIVGTTSLILGIIGIFLPLLPTTPFLLLTAAMYFRSSPRWYHWLIQQKYLGSYIRNFRAKRAVFFGVNLTARKEGKDTPEGNVYVRKFLQRIRWTPEKVGVFAGALLYPRYKWIDRVMIQLIMKITNGETDTTKEIEYTDWEKVKTFAESLNS